MNFLLQIPLEIRLVVLFVLGAAAGGQINRGIYRLAWRTRSIGPWSKPPHDAPSRSWFDRIPILGWISLRRESSLQGPLFWVRPLLIELAIAVGLAALYWWEVQGALLPQLPVVNPKTVGMQTIIHVQFVAHVVLIGLMIVATFIDFDEQTIPDTITVPGVLFGLVWAAAAPQSLMLTVAPPANFGGASSWGQLLLVTPPEPWPTLLHETPGLAIGLACYLVWCAALLPYVWTTRRGWKKAVVYLVEKIRRETSSWIIGGVAVAGAMLIVVVWLLDGRPMSPADNAPPHPGRWPALLTALVGMAFGGGLVWIIRIIAGVVMGREAMGFGDVTLMAMIGAFLGWQASLMIFFMAPFAALFIAVGQVVFTRRPEIAFGPYLSLAALLLIVYWNTIWNDRAADVFSTLGWIIPQILGFCLILFAGMLWAWVKVKELLWGAVRLN